MMQSQDRKNGQRGIRKITRQKIEKKNEMKIKET